ncbi:hypothetical protein [Thermodesulforhabdus norvegica]|uniref:Uncharacterized protein n=1 Tax=Thermodesulforhabdus norvegica TaxID=39841 RepID=A0A1I4SDE8_9BACT|nr:hypothetical protein [Thermodesulforhabdus norvegica]SFM62502.1 hypothetical protein SAMN05660836_00903 [Thermodesulforhabdus norvegica]
MKVFVGGLVAVFLGIIGIFTFFGDFLHLLAGAVPLMLLVGGAMAAYLGYDEVKDQVKLPFLKKGEQPAQEASDEDVSKYKEELEKYKAEVEKLKAELEKKSSSEEQ